MTDLGEQAADLLAKAYELALDEGLTVVGSDALLVAGRKSFGSVGRDLRPVGGLVDDATPSGLDEGDLREAAWRAVRFRKSSATDRRAEPPVWSAEMWPIVADGLRLAQQRGLARANSVHLLEAALNRPGSRAVALCGALGIAPRKLLLALQERLELTEAGSEQTTILNTMVISGVVTDRDASRLAKWLVGKASGLLVKSSGSVGPVFKSIEWEVVRQAVRAGHRTIGTAHLLLAAISFQEKVRAKGESIVDTYAPFNRAGLLLARHGVTLPTATSASAPGSGPLVDSQRAGQLWDGGNPADPGWSQAAAEAFDAANVLRLNRGDDNAGTTHLLAVIAADPASDGARMLAVCGVDPTQIAQEALADLG